MDIVRGVFLAADREEIGRGCGLSGISGGERTGFPDDFGFSQAASGALQGLFDQVLQIALQAGTMKLGRVVLDGSKVKANASKHKAMSYGRMQEDEKRLKEEVRRLLAQAEATDAEEDTRFGPDRSGDELLPELARRETRLKRRPTMPRLRWDLTSI
jgi:hypothetical protein